VSARILYNVIYDRKRVGAALLNKNWSVAPEQKVTLYTMTSGRQSSRMTTAVDSRVWRLLLRGYPVVLPLSTKELNIEHKALFHLGGSPKYLPR